MKGLSGNQSFMEMYKQLAELIKEASRTNDPDLTQKIIELKDEIKNLQLRSDPTDWGYASYSLFEKINSNRLFGKPAADYIESLVDHGTHDYNAIYSELNKTIKHFGKFSDNISKFSSLFELILPSELANLDSGSNSSILLYFEEKLTIQSISDLERYSRLWDNILGVFCNLTGEDKPTVEISNYNRGNVVLGVAPGKSTLKAFISGADGMINCLPVVLKIKRIQHELSLLSLQTDLTDQLSQEIEYMIDKTAEEVAENLAGTTAEGGNYNQSLISLSLKQILSFIIKGGKIEYTPVIGNMADEKIKRNLNESFRTAREIEAMTNSFSEENI